MPPKTTLTAAVLVATTTLGVTDLVLLALRLLREDI